ncbi:MAG: hypothetical protein COV66_05905 [Nitrospinae bacterium CG11_big_fil_rev_8_21_14_0_20_45_15]|nr:MAG: hypothetical protein COV66_05905 [Nitrospinae bacterium CG11_big_fil_rev_8_21_14_0_20_45_15]
MTESRSGKSGWNSIGDIFSSSLKLSNFKKADPEDWIHFHWPLVVGKEIASISQVEEIKRKVLHVRVSTREWLPALEPLKNKFTQEINQRAGMTLLTSIKFKIESNSPS